MKKICSFILLISVLAISLIFSCNLGKKTDKTGKEGNSNGGNGNENKTPDYVEISAKKLDSTVSNSKSASKGNASDYTTEVTLKFEYKNDDESVTVSEKASGQSTFTNLFKVKKEGLSNFIKAMTILKSNKATAVEKRGDFENTEDLRTNASSNTGDKEISKLTVYTKNTVDSTNGNKHQLFFDLGKDGTANNPSYMIEVINKVSEAEKSLEFPIFISALAGDSTPEVTVSDALFVKGTSQEQQQEGK